MLVLMLVAVFLAVAGIVLGAYLFANRQSLAAADAVRARLHSDAEAEAARSILKDVRASHVPFLDRWLTGLPLTERIRRQLERAGSSQKPGVFLLSAAVCAVCGLAIADTWGGIFGIAFVAVGLALPWGWLAIRQRRRLEAFEALFPDTLDMLANAMRAGYSFQAAAHFIGEEVAAPVGPEFARFYEEQRLGIDVRTALLAMQERVGSLNVKMFVTAVLIQRETGGNLTELLENIGTLMRERVAVQGQIDTLTAEPKLSARVLTALPVAVFFGLSAVNPTFMSPFTQSDAGRLMLLSAIVSVIIGYVMLMRIADIDI